MGQKINEDKTKYMIMTRRLINKQNLNIGQYTFEQVDNFKYLGVNINANNNIHNEINLRLMAANRSYFAMNKMFKSRLCKKNHRQNLILLIYVQSSCIDMRHGQQQRVTKENGWGLRERFLEEYMVLYETRIVGNMSAGKTQS